MTPTWRAWAELDGSGRGWSVLAEGDDQDVLLPELVPLVHGTEPSAWAVVRSDEGPPHTTRNLEDGIDGDDD